MSDKLFNVTWRPLLTGSQRDAAWQAISDIAETLSEYPIHEDFLPSLSAEFAILFSYLARARSGFGDEETAIKYLNQAIETISNAASPALHEGFTGVAWTCEHLPYSASNSVVDAALERHLKRTPWTEDYDLISGLVGFGVYAIERFPRRSAQDCLKLVLQRLEELSEETYEGVTWRTPINLLPEWQREQCPHGCYNLGMAHGIPGVIAILGASYAAGTSRNKTKPLLEGAINWILQQKLPNNASSTFSSWTGPGVRLRPARSAWCYGDPGVAAALLLAARSAKNKTWKKQALKIACRAAKRPSDEAGIRDASLCHGTAGLGHIFNRMFQSTGNRTLGKAARSWYARTLEFRRHGKGIAGFSAYWPGKKGRGKWVDEPDFLIGSCGIALALLAAVTPVPPDWDRLMLLSAKPLKR